MNYEWDIMRLLMEHHVDSQPLEMPHLKPS